MSTNSSHLCNGRQRASGKVSALSAFTSINSSTLTSLTEIHEPNPSYLIIEYVRAVKSSSRLWGFRRLRLGNRQRNPKNYLEEDIFSTVTAVVNRPLKLEDTHWPLSLLRRPKLELVSSVNLLNGTAEEFAELLKRKTERIVTVTHAYYFSKFYRKVFEKRKSNERQRTSKKTTKPQK